MLSGALICSFFLVSTEKAHAGFFGDLLNIIYSDKTKADISAITVESADTMGADVDTPITGTQSMSALQSGSTGTEGVGDMRTINDSSAIQTSPPSLTDDREAQAPSKKITTYVVKEGDTLYSIADTFDITLEPLVCWATILPLIVASLTRLKGGLRFIFAVARPEKVTVKFSSTRTEGV